MVGKIKHVRQKLHQEAVKLDTPSSLKTPAPPAPFPAPPAPIAAELHNTTPNTKSETSKHVKQVLGAGIFQSGIFAGTNITPEALVQTLKFEDPPDVPVPAKKGKTLRH
ncbi:protein FAM207A [Plectropomus leopardus]|uniref:protein FAM207A n=1 Tax=Plectropomus leopardus TaxID=160734 RepID=UPI001C4CA483|nr:protein FAM207A [Plectropomus leopardus]